jgi:hypothetical protein
MPVRYAGIVIPLTHDGLTRYFVGRPGSLTPYLILQSHSNSSGYCYTQSGGSGSYLPAEEVTGLLDLTFPIPLPITVVSGGN